MKSKLILLLFIFVFTLFSSCDNCKKEEAPAIDFISHPSAAPDKFIPFEAPLISSATLCGPFSYEWDFGDGQTSNLEKPYIKYAASGDYLVTVKISNSGGSDTESKIVQVRIPDGDVYFWSNNSSGYIYVTMNGTTRTITGWMTQFQGCYNHSYYASFTNIPQGVYNYSAVAWNGYTWSGTVNLADNCESILLN